jgi:hypothetical protein
MKDKILELQEKVIAGNNELLALLNSLPPDLYNYYLPLVKKLICKK